MTEEAITIYKQAYRGVKKLFISEILNLISAVFALVSSLIFVFTAKMSESDAAIPEAIALVLLFASLLIAVISLIWKIIGLSNAKRNESLFKTAFGFAIVGIVCNVVLLFSSGMFENFVSGIEEAATLLTTIYTVLGIYSLALKLDDRAVIKAGKLATVVVAIIFAFAVLDRVVGLLVPRLDGLMAIASDVMEVFGSAVLLTYLAMSKKMLAKGKAETA